MQTILFISVLATLLGVAYGWAFKHLPHERWQILGTIPIRKQPDGQWLGLNLTYYGLINACSVTFALLMTLILLAAVGLPLMAILLICCGMLMVCAPGAKWIAYWVEHKKHTFTIGGAAFIGLIGAPLLLAALRPIAMNGWEVNLPVMPIVAAMAIGYAFGEGSGRLACLSFGCCYGKPIDRLPGWLRRTASLFSVVFQSETKKAVYAGGFNGRKILAVQAITAVVYTSAGLLGVYLFLEGHHAGAYLVCTLVTQIWRCLSEFLRADYRGGGKISAYQYLAAIAAAAAVVYSLVLPGSDICADLALGLAILWRPEVIVIAHLLWTVIFIYMGRSKITAARISLYVKTDRI